jgi:GAF domain-containing protein
MSNGEKLVEQVEICLSETGTPYVRNQAAITEIVRHVHAGNYCAILGPRYCQKSLLLKDVKATLETLGNEVCVLVDLQGMGDIPDADFAASFAALVEAHGKQPQLQSLHTDVSDEQTLQRFFHEYLLKLDSDLILLIDHLEHIRMGPLQSLLRTLRAVYNARNLDDRARLGVVTTSSFSIAAEALGPTSPFNIAHSVLVRDLGTDESVALIQSIMKQGGIELTPDGLHRLLWATAGDRYLINQLCTHFLNSEINKDNGITELDVSDAIDLFLGEKASQYPPLRETVRALEGNLEALMNFLDILSDERVLRRQLSLDPYSDVDSLQLTGAVNLIEAGESTYEIRNEIYYRYLKEHFTHDRVVHVVSMAGEWEQAIGYLERVVVDNPGHRSTLLGTILDSIYAARTASEAYRHLASRLSRAFNIPGVSIYIQNLERSHLELVSQTGFHDELPNSISLDNSEHAEVEAYFSQHYLVKGAPGEQVIIAPLLRNEWQCLGVATISGFNADPQEDDFQELLAFLKQVGRAIGNINQLTALYETGKQVTSSLDLEQTMQITIEAAIKAVPGAQRGSLLLWEETEQKLLIKAHKGYLPQITEEIRLRKGEGYVGIAYSMGEPIRIGNMLADTRTLLKKGPDISKQKSVIAVPLKAWGHVIGVLCLDNTSTCDAFQESDLELLSTFAAQAAIAIQNARLSTELYQLGMRLNRGDLTIKQIFEFVVQSITTVTGAKGANMLLLRDVDKSRSGVDQAVVLSVSHGLGPYYDARISPRPAGLTLAVLQDGMPRAISGPGEFPDLNPHAKEQGIKAQLCLPMIIQDSITGVLFVHYDKPHFFSEIEIKMLSLFANHAAMAIGNNLLLERVKSQLAQVAHQEALRRTSQMVAHRLRNVLPVVSDRIGRILDGKAVTGKAFDWGRVALTETRRAQRIVRDFETFSRTEAFERPSVLSGARLVQTLHDVVKENLNQRNAQVEMGGHLDTRSVQVNVDRLSDDFINFTHDSQRHKPSGLQIFISCEAVGVDSVEHLELPRHETYLKLIYTDNGPGVSLELKEKIFDAFYTSTGGSGLGLAIAKYNARVHGGTLIECGQPESGVRFELYLPIVRSVEEEYEANQ